MAKKRQQKYWFCGTARFIELFQGYDPPVWNNYGWSNKGLYIDSFCRSGFKRITGVNVGKGECFEAMITVRLRKPRKTKKED